MAVTSMCEHCFATFPASAKAVGKEVKCPNCSERIRIQPMETDGEQVPKPKTSSAKPKRSKADDVPLPPPRAAMPSRSKPKKRVTEESRQSRGIVGRLSSLMELIGEFRLPLLALSALAIVGVMAWNFTPGMRFRAQKTYRGEHGSPRTTREWLEMVKENETKLRTGTEEAKNQNVIHKHMTGDIVQFLGPDPAAIPDLFEALANEEYPRLRFIADEVLKKFESSSEKPIAEDVFAGLKHPNQQVVSWATRLLAKLGTDAKPMIGELTKSLETANRFSAPAVANSLAAIGADALPVLTAQLDKAPNEVTPAVIRAIGLMGPAAEPVVLKLAGFLTSQEPSLRSAALQALQVLGPTAKPAVPNLIEFLEKSSAENEVTVAAKILSNPQLETVPDLTKLLRSDSVRTRKRAISTLSDLDKAALPALPTLIEISSKPADNDEERGLQNSVRQLLAKLGKVIQPVEVVAAPPAGALEALEEMTILTLQTRISGKQVGKTNGTIGGEGQRGQFTVIEHISEFVDDATQTKAQSRQRRVNELLPIASNDPRLDTDPRFIGKADAAMRGQLKENVEREDSETLTWSQGDQIYSGVFLDGKRQGRWVRKHANGRVWVMGIYRGDQKIGQFAVHDESGKRIWVGVYQEDRLVSTPKPDANAGFIALALESAPSQLVFDPNGHRLAVAQGNLLTLYDCETWQECGHQSLPGVIQQIDFAPSGAMLLVTFALDAKSSAAVVCEGATGVLKLEIPSTVSQPRLSTDGQLVAGIRRANNNYNDLIVYDVNTQQIKFQHDGTVPVQSTKSGRSVIGFNSLSFSPDHPWLAVGGDTSTYLFDVSSGEVRKRFDLPLSKVSFTSDKGCLLGTARDGHRAKIDCETGISSGFGWKAGAEVIATADRHLLVELHRKGRANWIEKLRSVNLRTGQETFYRHFGEFAQVVVSPAGEFLAFLDAKNGAVWNVRTGETIKKLPELHSGTFSGHGHLLAAFETHWQNENRRIQVLNLITDQRRVIEIPEPRAMSVNPLLLSPDGRFLAVAQRDLTVTVWDLTDFAKIPDVAPKIVAEADPKPANRFDDWREVAVRTADTIRMQVNVSGNAGAMQLDREPAYYGLVFTSDRKKFLAHGESVMRLWQSDANPKTAIVGVQPANHGRAILSPDGKVLCCGNKNSSLNFWDMKKGELLSVPKPDPSSGTISQICFSPDGKIVASADGSAKTVRLWDVSKRKVERKLGDVPKEVLGVAFGADDSQLACVGSDGNFHIINLENDSQTKLKLPSGSSFSRLYALPKTQYWLMQHYAHAATLTLIPFAAPHTPLEISLRQSPEDSSMLTSCCITADEQFVAVGTTGAKVLLVSLSERKIIRELHGHLGAVSGVAFSPGDEFLATSGQNGTLRIWGRDEFPFPLDVTLPTSDSKSKTSTKTKSR